MMNSVKTEINQVKHGEVWNSISLNVEKEFKYDINSKIKLRRMIPLSRIGEKIEERITQHVFEFCSLSSART